MTQPHRRTRTERELCLQWRSVKKYVDGTYGTQGAGRPGTLNAGERFWLRCFALKNPKFALAKYPL